MLDEHVEFMVQGGMVEEHPGTVRFVARLSGFLAANKVPSDKITLTKINIMANINVLNLRKLELLCFIVFTKAFCPCRGYQSSNPKLNKDYFFIPCEGILHVDPFC